MAGVTMQTTWHTDRLRLRAITLGDAEALFAIYGDLATQQFNPAGPYRDMDTAKRTLATWWQHWQQHGVGPWAISLADQLEHIIGFGGLSYMTYLPPSTLALLKEPVEPSSLAHRVGCREVLNVGYRFATTSWGKGYATELTRFALDHACNTLMVKEVFAIVRPGHLASIKVLEKAGMHRIGQLDDVPGHEHSVLYQMVNPV